MARGVTTGVLLRQPRLRPVWHGLVLAGLLVCAYLFVIIGPAVGTFGFDAFAYWAVDVADPYKVPVGGLGAFTYTPVAARAFDPVGLLSWPAFLWIWSALQLGTVLWLGGRRFLWILALPPVALELFHGNVHLLLAAMCVLGVRYPAVWVFGIFTKATPGIGLLWFVVRREWRNLAIALGLTAIIGAVSLVMDGRLWTDWIALAISAESGGQVAQAQVPVPLWLRLPIAAIVVIWGARTDRRWTLCVAVTLSLPVLWPSGFAVLAGCLALSPMAGRPWFRLGNPEAPGAPPAGATVA